MTPPIDNLPVEVHPATGIRVCVVGAGYVGLTVAAGLACLGHRVVCADSAVAKVRRLRAGQVPFLEAGLPELVARMRRLQRLTFTTDTVTAASGADVVFLCVPTPQGAEGEADLRYVFDVLDLIGPALAAGAVVVNKSTVPVGTADVVARRLGRDDIAVVADPEFLAEGTALRDFFAPDRIVVGSSRGEAAAAIARLYAGLSCEVICTDARSAELIKYASNAFLATKLSFVNSLAELCDAVDADVRVVAHGMGTDHRIGAAFLRPGPGWGGSCFPKDTHALVRIGADHGVDLPLVRAAIRVNEDHRRSITGRIILEAHAAGSDPVVAVWGVTYKAGTDDVRDSPALAIVDDLRHAGVRVQVYDPARSGPLAGVTVCADAYAACRGAAVLVVATEWPEFSHVNMTTVRALMVGDTVIDTRNVLDAAAVRAAGLAYTGMGLRSVPLALANPAPVASAAALPR